MRSMMGSWGAPPPAGLADRWAAMAAHPTMLHAFQAAVERRPDHLALRVIMAGGGTVERTYAQLGSDVRRAAGGLLAMGLARGDRIVLCAPSSIASISTYLAALALGILPIFVRAPRNADSVLAWDHVHDIAERVRACAVGVQSFPEHVPSGRDYARVDQIAAGPALDGLGPLPRPDEAAHLRLTSGAAGDPRVAAVGHRQVAAKLRAIGAAVGVRPQDHLYIWLPLDHDMGLIALSCALYWQRPITLTDSRTFAREPVHYWLRAMSQYRCTITAAPSSAYVACARLAARRSFDGLDLSACRVAIWASEPVLPSAVELFVRAFGRYGYHTSSTLPCERLTGGAPARPLSPLFDASGLEPETDTPQSGRAAAESRSRSRRDVRQSLLRTADTDQPSAED